MGKHEKSAENRPASTDMKDVQTWDPTTEDMQGRPLAHDVHARVLAVTAENDTHAKIAFSAGEAQGAVEGMKGYAIDAHGNVHSFTVIEVSGGVGHGVIEGIPSDVNGFSTVVLNPKTPPNSTAGAKKDLEARIVGVSIVDGKTQIMIGMGEAHGARVGMKGYIGAKGKPYAHFTISHFGPGGSVSLAKVDVIPDELKADGHDHVVLNPSHE
jgi:hypothetical protein